jgi:hypothetical protein
MAEGPQVAAVEADAEQLGRNVDQEMLAPR